MTQSQKYIEKIKSKILPILKKAEVKRSSLLDLIGLEMELKKAVGKKWIY